MTSQSDRGMLFVDEKIRVNENEDFDYRQNEEIKIGWPYGAYKLSVYQELLGGEVYYY